MVDRHKEAEKLYQEAVKLTTPSLLSFRMRGEWERATPLWERAAMLFKVRQKWGRDAHQGFPPPPPVAAATCCPPAVPPGHTPPHPTPPCRSNAAT